jgi:hypothetical protein
MYLMANENGDWLEMSSEGAKLFLLSPTNVHFQEYLRSEGLTFEEWLAGDKQENEIMQFGLVATVTKEDFKLP